MARKFHRRQPMQAMSEINITPMLDLAFSLLIIFLVSSPLLEQTIPVALPVQAALDDPPPAPPRPQTIGIDLRGQYFWGEEAVTLAELDRRVAFAAQQVPQPVFHLRADRGVTYQRVVDVMDILQRHEIAALSFDTERRER